MAHKPQPWCISIPLPPTWWQQLSTSLQVKTALTETKRRKQQCLIIMYMVTSGSIPAAVPWSGNFLEPPKNKRTQPVVTTLTLPESHTHTWVHTVESGSISSFYQSICLVKKKKKKKWFVINRQCWSQLKILQKKSITNPWNLVLLKSGYSIIYRVIPILLTIPLIRPLNRFHNHSYNLHGLILIYYDGTNTSIVVILIVTLTITLQHGNRLSNTDNILVLVV